MAPRIEVMDKNTVHVKGKVHANGKVYCNRTHSDHKCGAFISSSNVRVSSWRNQTRQKALQAGHRVKDGCNQMLSSIEKEMRVSRNERRAIIASVDDAAPSKRYRQACDNKWEKLKELLFEEYPEIFSGDPPQPILSSITKKNFLWCSVQFDQQEQTFYKVELLTFVLLLLSLVLLLLLLLLV